MKTKARQDSIRKRRNIEEKYNWDPMSNADKERSSHKNRAIIATIIVDCSPGLFPLKIGPISNNIKSSKFL